MPRRSLEFQDFNSLQLDLENLQRLGYTKVGNWDLSQTCQHLSKTVQMSVHGMTIPNAPWLVRTLVAPFVLRSIFKKKKMPEGIKVPQEILPNESSDASAELITLAKHLNEFQNHSSEFAMHPFFGRLSADQWRKLHLIHAAHHLSFLIPNAPH